MNQIIKHEQTQTYQAPQFTAAEIKAQVNLIQEVMASVMKPGTHYDVIPGTGDKPSLLKAGAEKILATFRIACVPEVEDLSTKDEIRYRITAKGIHQPTGIVVGAGVGECSSNEEKYKWRAVVCDAEWEATREDRRRIKYGKTNNEPFFYEARQVRTEPSDVANTILKMCKKRAMVDLTLTATAASDVFNQDMEDLPPELVEIHKQKTKAANNAPRVAAGNSKKPATEGQCKLLRTKLNQAKKTEEDLCKAFGIDALEKLTMGQVNDAIAWVTQ